ncbi:MAG TPA: GNAT family N-acetyltransferase [Methylomirabilota bacterium]
MSAYRVRAAVEADAAAICEIYNQGIEDRLATLETERRTPEERRQWLKSRAPRHPVVVAETTEPDTISNGPPTAQAGATQPDTISNRPPAAQAGATQPETISNRPPTAQAGLAAPATIGWGSLNPYNPREAYRHVADFSIYVERAYRGRGVGKLLLTRLIELARELGYHKLVLSAFPFNAAGMALYERLGFRTVGIYKEQGLLDGRWVDTIVMEKLL